MEDMFIHLLGGFAEALQPVNLLMLVVGCTVGLFVGALPGLGSVNGVAILLPLTFLVPPNAAIIFLAAIYCGAMYGGAISSVTLGIPGASTAVATVFDGRPLASAGKADVALLTAATASFIGGTISVVMFTLFAPPLAEFALRFGPPEEFALMLLFGVVGYLLRKLDYPVAPAVLAIVLGPIAEPTMRQSLLLSQGAGPYRIVKTHSSTTIYFFIICTLSIFRVGEVAIRIATMIRIGGFVFSAALLAFGSVTSAGNLKSFHQHVADAYAPYRSAMFYLRTGNPGVALLELEAASERWQAVVDQFGKAVPDAFVDDPGFAASLEAIGGSFEAGFKSLEDDDQKTATDALTTIRADLSDLRRRNSIRTYSDCIDDMNAAMDRLWAFRHEPPAFDQVDQVNAVKREASITEFLYRRCYETAPSTIRDDESFKRMFEGSLVSLPLIFDALDQKNEGLLINILRELRSFDRMIWLHFG